MNPEELYLQYQSNGGNLSLEDFLNMQSYLEPNDFSALIQDTTSLKKKEDTNTSLLSSQGLSTSNNEGNINPISVGQNIPQEILSAPIDSQLDLNQNQLDQQNGISNLENSNSESALTSGSNVTPFTTNLPVNTQNPLAYKGNMDNLILDENGNTKSKVGTISFPNDNPNNNTTTFNSGVTVPNIYLPDESKVDFSQLPKNYIKDRKYYQGQLMDYTFYDFTGKKISDPISFIKDQEDKGYVKPVYNKEGSQETDKNGLPAYEVTKSGAEYFTNKSEEYAKIINKDNAESNVHENSVLQQDLSDLEKFTNSLFNKYGYLVTEEDRSNYLQTPEGRKELQIALETQQELGYYPNATYQQVYDMVSRRYNKPDEYYLDKAQSVLGAMMNNQKQTAFDDFSNRFGSDNEVMPDDVAENKFYLEVEKNYDLKKLFGEFLDSEEGQLYTRTDQSIKNNTNGQRNRKNIWNAFSNWTNKKELLDIEAKQNNISNLKYNVQSAAESGDFNLVNQYVNQINSVQNSIQNNIKNVQQNDSITSDVNKIFTRVNKEDSEAQAFQAKVLSGDKISRIRNIRGQLILGLSQSVMDLSSSILRILTTPFSQNVKDSVDQLNEPLKLGNIEISPLRTNVTKYSDNSGRVYEERNGKLFQIENGVYKPVSKVSGLKETGKDSEYNPSGMAFLTGKMAGDILITNEVGGLINKAITNNAISLASKTSQAFGAESEIAKQARNFARYAQSANTAANKSVSGWFVQMYNDSYKSAEDSGISSTAGKTVYATVNSFIQSLIQRINPDSKFLSGFNNEYKQLLSSLSTSSKERILANGKALFTKIADNVVGETKEELIQQVVGDMTNYVTNVISGSDFKLTDGEGYKDVVVGTIVPSVIASLMGGSGTRNIKLGNNKINLSNYNRSQLLTELSRFDGADNMLNVMSNDSSFDSYSNTLDEVKNEVLTRKKYINKIPDSQNYSTESLDSAIKLLQQLDYKRTDLNQADAAFKPRIESEISSLESQVEQILNETPNNESTTPPEQTPEGTQGQEDTTNKVEPIKTTNPEEVNITDVSKPNVEQIFSESQNQNNNENQINQQNNFRQNTQQPEQQSSFNENTPVESTNSPTETIRHNENAQTSNISEEVNFDDLLDRVNKIFNDQTRSSTNSNERVQSALDINQEQQASNSETVQTNELPGSTNQVEVNQNDLRSQDASISNDINPNQTRLSENVIATTEEIRLPDGDNGYRVTVTDNNGNLIEDRNGDSEYDFSDQSEVDKFINQKQRGFSLSKQPRTKTEVPVTESTVSTNYVGKRVSFNQFGDTRSGVVESESKGRLTIKGDDGKTYFTGTPLVQNLKDESGNPIQLQKSSENFIPISKEAFDSLIEKLKKPFAKAFKNLNITTDWNEFLNKSKSLGLNINFDAKFSINDNARKEKQLELINKKNPAPNDYNTWIRTTNDILTADEAFKEAFQDGEMYPDFTVEDMQNVLDSGEVTVYSSYPVKEGIFVTPSRMNAESYSGDGKVYSKKVNASDLAWIDQGEGQYAPVKFMRNNNGTIYGAKLPDGTIYINPEYLNANTPIHEFSHLWEQLMPSRFKKGVELLKQTKTGKEIFNRLKSEGNYNNLSDNELWNEALNTHIGNYGEWQFQERQARGKMAEFVQWFRAFFNKIGDVLGIGNINPNISLNNFTNKVLGDLMNEKILSSENSNSFNINYSLGSNELNNIAESTKRHIKEYSTFLKNKEKLKNGELTNENTIRIVNESRFNDDNYTIDLGRPSNLLKSIGVSDNEMNVNLSYLFNKIIKQSKHEISDIQNLRNIVDNIQDPVAVFDNYEDGKKTRDRLEFLTSLKNSNNKNIALILSLNEENSSDKINTIKTGFALNNLNRLRARLLNNYDGIKYINKQGIIEVLRDNINVGDSIVKIRYDKNTDSIKLLTEDINSNNVKFLKETIDLINGFKNPSINNVNFSIRTDNTNKLKIKDDVELSNFFGDNTTSIDELLAKGYNISDDIANLARKFETKIYLINENLFNKSEKEINSYVDDLMKDYQILIDNGTYEESYLRQELLDGIITQVFNDALGEAKGNSIYIKEGATDLNNFLKTKLVQHELAHVFTSYYLADNIDSSQLNEQELAFRNEARSAYEEVLKNPNKTNAYGYSNTYEFIAEYIANDNFKSEVDNYLDSLNNPEPKSLLTRIVDYIKGLFGFKNNTELKQEFQLQKSIDEHINRLKNADGSINLQAYSGVRFMIKKLMPISTIQEVLNETETKGIEAGLAKFKESAFYKSLSDKQKSLIDSEGITKLMQEQVILHREDQINKKKTAVEKAKEQTSKKEKEIAFNKIEKIHENYKNKIEELRKSNKSYREKVAERKRQAKEAYDNTVIFLNQNMISGKITPTEVSRLLKAATGILSTRNSISNFNKFTELYNKINARAEERNKTQIERTTDKYNEVSQSVEKQFNSGKSLQEIKDSFNSIDEQRMVESAYNRLANKTISPEDARKKLDDSYKSSKEVLTKRFKDENGNVMSFNQKFRAWLKNKVERGIVTGVDRQFIPKRILENIGAKAVSNRMIAYAGSSTIAKEKFDKVQKNVYDGLNRSELELLDKIIAAKRFIAIDKNREEKGLPVVDHPGYQDASTAQKALDAYKSEIGEDAFTKLNKRADAYFDAFKNILSDMRESGLISNEVYEELKDVDYQPRKFLRYILDADGELMSSDRTMFRNENGNLSKEQIIGLSEGDASDLLMDSKWLIQSALASRYKAIGMNEINRTFFTKYYPDAKAKFESINPDNIPVGDKKFYKYFKQLQSNIKENRIIGFTESGKPKYETTTPEGYKIAYYYENGVRHQVFMKEEFHKMWHDTMDKLVNSDLAQTISTWSGSRLVKAFATGNNPGFVFTNTPRDFVHALLFSPEYSSFLLRSGVQLTKDSIKAIGEIYKHRNSNKTTLLTKYLEYGGGMEWLNQQGEIKDLTSLNKTIGNYFDSRIDPKSKKILSTLFDFARLKSLSNYSETMFRVAVFDRSLQNQLKEYNKINNTYYKSVEELSNEDKNNMYYEAVASSRGLLDFNQGGTFTKSAEAVIPYLNAATQGTRVMVEAIKRNPLDTSVRIIQAAGLPVLGMHLMISFIMGLIRPPEKEDEPVNKSYADFLDGISPSQKMNYWNIPVGWDKEEKQWKVLRIAKAQQLTPISILFEGAYEDHIRSSVGMTKRGSIKNTWKNFAKALGDNIDPTHLASALEDPSKSQSYFDAAFKLIGSNPASKGLTQYYTGYDTFREQPLSFDIGKVSRKYEGADKANVEDFYKELGKALDDSPVRLKALVESIITSPQTNPFVGIMYGGADAIVTDVDAKKRAGVIYDSFIKRILSETSDFNRQLNKKALVQEQLDKNTDEYGETRNKAKQILNKYGSVNELLKNEKSLIADIEGYSKDPVIQKDLVNRIKSLVKKDGISSMVFDVKYGTNNNVKNKALLIYTYSEGMSSTEKRRFFEQLQSQKILSKAVISEYENVIKQNKK